MNRTYSTVRHCISRLFTFHFSLFTSLLLAATMTASAQNIRYVKMATNGGSNTNNGTSWATAKADIQDAINDLVNNNLTGEVWVQGATDGSAVYYPTETTQSSGSQYYKSFKIPAGITVRGGFAGTELTAAERVTVTDKNFGKGSADPEAKDGKLDGEDAKSGVYQYKTILSGDVTGKKATFTWNDTKQQFDVTFYGNSYHVVWFAMNGFTNGRANPLVKPAKLEGCVVENGRAYTRNGIDPNVHEGYGGGIYMVANSFVYNCEVRNCEASRNGGGIYMDGGGIVRRTLVHNCQALGIGTEFGLGGGICEDGAKHNSKANPIVVAQSVVTNCVGRMGGGMALDASQSTGNNKYAVVVNSTLVNNNTAQVEAGGVYTYKGGGVSSATIVRNKCNGSGITQSGQLTGRSGGLYCRDASLVGNTVIWGNKCEANKDIQYADSRASLQDTEKTVFYYNALNNAEIADWSKAEKLGVLSLDDLNSTTGEKGKKGYPLFENPTTTAGYLATAITDNTINWKVFSESALHHAGINTVDLDYEGLTPAPAGKSWDMQFGEFNSRCTLGAIISEEPRIAPNTTQNPGEAHFYVDPDYNFAQHHDDTAKGMNWTTPTRFLGNVFEYINDTKNSTTLSDKTIFIHVKQGTVDNTDSYKAGRVRTTTLDVPSNVTLLGSYDASLTGTNLDKRNVVRTPTVISGKLLDDYKFNIAHLLNLENDENVTIDGFQISYANAASTELGNTNKYGAAITIKGSNTGIKIKNVIVNNSTAEGGAAIYADKSTVTFENCIFHNNTTTQLANSGVVYATNNSHLTFDHCDVIRNVGHASYLGSNATRNQWTNSIFYGNMDRPLKDTNTDAGGGIGYALAAFSGNTANVTGSYCMFDSKSASFATNFGGATPDSEGNLIGDTGNKWQFNLQYAFIDGTGQGYPRFINPTKNSGVTEDGDQTYYGRATSFEPHNNNPVVNLAKDAVAGNDIIGITRNYGGLPDIGAVENHEATEGENAYKDGQKAYGEVLYVRDYNTYNADGTVKTTDTNIIDRDGTSWERAINGNADYTLVGTRTYKDTRVEAVMAYRLHNGTSPNEYYLDVNNGTLNRVNSQVVTVPKIDQETGNPVTDSNGDPITEQYNPAERCTVFILCDASGNDILAGGNITSAKRLKDASTGEYLYLDYVKSNNTYTFRTSANPPAAQATATITASGGNYRIAYKANNTTKYISNANTIPSATQTAWTFKEISLSVEHGTGTTMEDVAYNMGTFKGLQYAVNKAHIAYKDDLSFNADPHKSKKQVWVGAGVYKRDPQVNSVANPIVDMDTENCFVIQDGVDVFGAFPKTGNPGKDQRQALVSQYVNNRVAGYSYTDYETILEPVTQGIASKATRRVLGQSWDYNPKKSGYKSYAGATWDGFTLRNGVMDEKTLIQTDADDTRKNSPGRNGGGGACIYKNVTLKNVVVTNNTTIWSDPGTQQDFRAGGIYIDGGTLDAGYIINNLMEGWSSSSKVPTQSGAAYGGGMYLYSGTVFNSVVANNRIYASYADGAGIFIENANFFNNTIVNNKAEGTKRACGGVAIWTDATRGTDSRLYVYNSIIAKNEGIKLGKIGNKDLAVQNGGQMELHNCISEDITDQEPAGNNKIIFKNCQKVTNYNDIFVTNGDYSNRDANNFKNLDLRLKATATNAINKGDEAPVIGGAVYNLIDYNDMDFAERIQDCRIDIGAYEFNGATSVAPDVTSESGKAIYYVTPEGYGTTNANDPANAACAEKLQRVLDAAGRYKYLNPDKQVIVKVANSYDLLHPKNVDGNGDPIPENDERYVSPTNFTYYATRTTDHTDQDVRVWSIIVPRGVEVWGGYTDVASNNTHTSWTNSDNGFQTRNITKNPTYFDSYYLNKLEKTDANTYHVVSFSDRIFDKNGYAYTKNDFKEKTDEQIRTILTNGDASTYVELPGNDESLFAHMSEAIDDVSTGVSGNVINIGTVETPVYASNRAVIDGIFVSGGKADASSQSSNSMVNINSYGGAALVNDYAYVRNCILTGNSATNGGALALTDRALVSGCLIMDNVATNKGGGIYVFENGTKLSNGITINSTAPAGQVMDYNMAHVITSTIVNNTAQQGGGIWYSNTNYEAANARFNSVAVWQNSAQDQDNVYGMINPEQPTEDETISEIYYPFSYSLIQNMRASGTNNLEAMAYNHQGVRFVNEKHDVGTGSVDQTDIAEEKDGDDKFKDFGYYGLTTYSTLCSTGMPKSYYNQMKEAIAIADDDFMGQPRVDNINNFVEIGARALPKRMPNKQLMLRLFVAHPDAVDTETATRFMRLTGSDQSKEEYYSQMGSSFAYPFNFLQDALDYVTRARNGQIDGLKLSDGTVVDGTVPANKDIVRNLPFEIVLGSGTYYPRQSLNGGTESVWAHTFAIPEGVTIIGGFNPQGGAGTYYGRYYKKGTGYSDAEKGDIYKYVDPIPTGTHSGPEGKEVGRGYNSADETVTLPAVAASDEHAAKDAKAITFQQWHIQDIADRRGMLDNNKNGIIEPWEFANQTIISGNAVNGETDGVYHIMTAVADADAVGLMPKVQKVNADFVGSSIDTETGYQWKEQGQQIRLNGLIVTGGNALTYLSTALDDYGSYMFYHGAGLVVDGNRYNASRGATPEFHNSAAYGVGYRDIPVSVTNCQFRNNIAGYGGAISSNGSLSLFASSFEQNKALGQTETPASGEHWYTNISGSKQEVFEVSYPGHGGAIHVTNQLSAFNTLFANNEACLAEDEPAEMVTIDLVQHPTFRVPLKANASATLRAAGGAIMMGSAAQHHIVNCDFVRNKANAYPAVFTMNPTVRQTPVGGVVDTHDYSQIINTVAWGNEVNPEMLAKYSGNTEYQTASKLMVNIGKMNRDTLYIVNKSNKNFYSPAFVKDNVPTTSELNAANPELGSWQEAAWFCAYEEGVGFKPNNTLDLREAIIYSPKQYAPTMIETAAQSVKAGTDDLNTYYQNCNMLIVADNNDVAGPNFGNPSVKAGFDGFMEGADWSPARFNRLTDNGNGWIKQTVSIDNVNKDFVVKFHNDDKDGSGKVQPITNFQGAYPITHYISELPGADGVFPEYKLWLALGNEKYMQATNETDGEKFINNVSIGTPQKNYPRISPDPTMGVTKAYIDIGVYEYQKQPLLKPGSEVDILWVSTKEKPENGPANGLTWKTPTSDLQKAIETLLQSRNGHKKEIRIMEGEYAPVTPKTVEGVSGKVNAFVIDTKSLNASAITPTGFNDGSNNDEYYAQSITIKGGYSSEIMYEYDPVLYKTIICQNEAAADVNTDHLIYIADPTLRYAGSTGVSQDNAVFAKTGDHESNTAKTMPIQIDGVTIINNKANAGVDGSAIYYPDVTDMTAAHSISVGGEVKYYETKANLDAHTHPVDHETEFVEVTSTGAETITNPAKLVITKAQVIGSGKSGDDNNGSAVYIGQNGGSALIYNTVFHSNYGMPLNAWNTVNVNNTFGLNAGRVQLNGDDSEMHNSALWKNNKSGGYYGPQVKFGDDAATASEKFSFNSYTEATVNDTYHITSLSDVNSNIAEGPNFVDPENVDIEARNFDLKPSMKLLNKGSLTNASGTYYDKIMHYDLGDSKYAKYDYALIPTTGVDVLNRPRFKNNIDLGAYEFQGSLYNILYVDPNKSHRDEATGENWDQAFGYGDMQNAMDLAAIYHATNTNKEAYVFVKGASSTNKDLNTNETLTIRDGVTVYGSIISNYNDWHNIPDPEHPDQPKYRKETSPGVYVYDIDAYIKDMTNQREGVASDAASKTIVTGIKVEGDATFDGTTNDTPALVDGFVVTNPTPVKESVLNVNNSSEKAVIVLRNIIVADNDLSSAPSGTDVAVINNGLLYEALLRDNKQATNGATLRVSKGTNYAGYAVNVTVEGKTIGADGSIPTADADGNNIYNSVINSIDKATVGSGTVGAYGTIVNNHISGYFYNIADPNLNYQLTETSKYIDMCDGTVNPMTAVAPNLAKFINYDTDRDLLGNPRLLVGVTDVQTLDAKKTYLDRGAFETWKVKNDNNEFYCGELGTISKYYTDAKYALIKKHFYPHDGSVCYIMAGQSLVIDAFDPSHEVKPTPHNPGFMLVQEGANFYGNGRPATCAYLAVERKVRKTTGSIVSIPYAMKYNENVSKPIYAAGVLTQLDSNVGTGAYEYNGLKRSDWKYIFQATDSKCWSSIANKAVTAANHGVLYQAKDNAFDGGATEVTLRFTGKGTSLTDYIYTEELADPVNNKKVISKTVTLTKYDDSESTNNGADYTDEKDMGWNCIGLPWLVSNYKTYETTTSADHGTDQDFMMQIPHEMWLYYDGTKSPDNENVNGDGGYYSVNSWDNTNALWHVSTDAERAIWVGEGFFVQTATLSDTETLTFYRPLAPTMTLDVNNSLGGGQLGKRYFFEGAFVPDAVETKPEVQGVVLVATEYYTADGMHLNTNGEKLDFNRLPIMPRGTVIIVRKHYSNGAVKTQKLTF